MSNIDLTLLNSPSVELVTDGPGVGLQSKKQELGEAYINATFAREKLLMEKNDSTIYSPLSERPKDLSHGTVLSNDALYVPPASKSSAGPAMPKKPEQKMPLDSKLVEEEKAQAVMSSGIKYDQGKDRYSIVPGLAIAYVMKVGEFGAKKYGDHNYTLGMPITKFVDAAFRHIFIEWLFKGIDNDPESGLPHLAHGAWNVLAALQQMLIKPELDNRNKL